MKTNPKKLLAVLLIPLLSGCSFLSKTTTETVKVVLGTSTRELEAARKDATSKQFNMAYEVAFQKVQDILKKSKCKIFYRNKIKAVLVAMNFDGFINTSEVGIFFTQIEPSKTKIEITSQTQQLADVASKMIFPELDKIQEKK